MRSRRIRRIVLTLAGVCSLALVAACGPPAPPPPPPQPSSPAADDIVARTNYLRSLGGTGGLTVDGNMQANAQFHADRLASGGTSCTGILWHSPELGAWYSGSSAAENVACVPGCPADAAQIIDLWSKSPPHNANMMNPRYSFVGTATKCNGSVMVAVGQYRS